MGKRGLTYFSLTEADKLPEWVALENTTFLRTGDSLMIVSASGEIIIMRAWFSGPVPPVMRTAQGHLILPQKQLWSRSALISKPAIAKPVDARK